MDRVAGYDVLRALEETSAKDLRLARIHALTDAELSHAIELLSDTQVVLPEPYLSELRDELRMRANGRRTS